MTDSPVANLPAGPTDESRKSEKSDDNLDLNPPRTGNEQAEALKDAAPEGSDQESLDSPEPTEKREEHLFEPAGDDTFADQSPPKKKSRIDLTGDEDIGPAFKGLRIPKSAPARPIFRNPPPVMAHFAAPEIGAGLNSTTIIGVYSQAELGTPKKHGKLACFDRLFNEAMQPDLDHTGAFVDTAKQANHYGSERTGRNIAGIQVSSVDQAQLIVRTNFSGTRIGCIPYDPDSKDIPGCTHTLVRYINHLVRRVNPEWTVATIQVEVYDKRVPKGIPPHALVDESDRERPVLMFSNGRMQLNCVDHEDPLNKKPRQASRNGRTRGRSRGRGRGRGRGRRDNRGTKRSREQAIGTSHWKFRDDVIYLPSEYSKKIEIGYKNFLDTPEMMSPPIVVKVFCAEVPSLTRQSRRTHGKDRR